MNLVKENGKVSFASRFDGAEYSSDRIVATSFGSLGQARELTYDVNGMIQFGGKLYMRMGNVLALFEDGVLKPLSVAESNAILYLENHAPDLNNVPVIKILDGQEIWLERLSPDICQDVQGRFWYYPEGSMEPVLIAQENVKGRAADTTVTYQGKVYLVISTDAEGNLCYKMPVRDAGGNVTGYLMAKSNGEILRVKEDGSADNTDPDILVTDDADIYENADDAGKNALVKDYAIGSIHANGALANVTITMNTPVASLVNGNPGSTTENIVTNGGDVIILADGKHVSVGSDSENPVVINANEGTVKVQKPDTIPGTDPVIAANTYLELTEDTRLTPERFVVDGVEYRVTGRSQTEDKVDITCGSMRVINGGMAT